jgi:hypothetical protein
MCRARGDAARATQAAVDSQATQASMVEGSRAAVDSQETPVMTGFNGCGPHEQSLGFLDLFSKRVVILN